MLDIQDVANLLGIDPSEGDNANMLNAAIQQATVIDAQGLAPTDADWTPTYDIWFAAAAFVELYEACRFLSSAGTLKSFTSEGTTMVIESMTSADLIAFANRLRARSSRWITSNVSVVELDNNGPWHPRSQFPNRWDQSGRRP